MDPTLSNLFLADPLERKIENRVRPDDYLIILSHYPAVTELCPGFDRLQRFMETCRPRVFLQGHIHEAFEQSCILTGRTAARPSCSIRDPGGAC